MRTPSQRPTFSSDLTRAEKLALLGDEFLKHPQVECPVTHSFPRGMYVREIRIPAGTLFIGRPHLVGHTCKLVEGEITLYHDDGHRLRLAAPAKMFTSPGYMIALIAHTDAIGRTYHPNPDELRHVETLEREIFMPAGDLKSLAADLRRRLS